MYGAPIYLNNLSGLAEVEPHYVGPTMPASMQPYVTNTPMNRGDGIRPTMIKPHGHPASAIEHISRPQVNGAKMIKQSLPQRNFGAPMAGCSPCQQRNPYLHGYGSANENENSEPSGKGWAFLQKVVQGATDKLTDALKDMTPEQKDAIKAGAVDKASMYACEKWGRFCPEVIEDAGQYEAKAPIGLYVGIGVGVLALGGVIYWAMKD